MTTTRQTKTIRIEEVKKIANRMLENSSDKMVEERYAIATMLETILHDTNNYEGFRFTRIPDDHDYSTYDHTAWEQIDQSRRFYY